MAFRLFGAALRTILLVTTWLLPQTLAGSAEDPANESALRQAVAEAQARFDQLAQNPTTALPTMESLVESKEELVAFLVEKKADIQQIRLAVRSLARSYAWLGGRWEQQGEYTQALLVWQRLAVVCRDAFGKDCPEFWDASRETEALDKLVALTESDTRLGQLLENRDNLRQATKDGALEMAQELALQDHQLCSELYGGTHPRTLSSLEFAARVALSRKDLEQSFELYEQALSLRRERYPTWHPALSACLLSLGSRYENAGSLEEAEGKYRQSVDTLQKWSCLVRIAAKYQLHGNLDRALNIYQEVFDASLATLGKGHPIRGLAAKNAGELCRIGGRYARAQELLLASVDIWSANANRFELANCLNSLALVCQQSGDYDSAEVSYDQAVDALGDDTSDRGRELKIAIESNFASLLEELGRYPEARKIYERLCSDPLAERNSSPVELTARENLARLYQTIGELQKSEALFDALLRIPDRQPAELARLHSLRGRLYLQIGSIDKADNDFSLAYRQLSTDGNASEADLAALASLRALVLLDKGEFPASLNKYEEVLDALEGFFGPGHIRCAEIHDQIAKALRGLGEYEQACAAHGRALDIYLQVFGSNHETVAWAYHRLGTTHFVFGQLRQAVEAWKQAYEIKQHICRQILPWLPEAQAAAFLTSLTTDDSSGGRDALLSALQQERDSRAIEALGYAWRSRGLVLDTIARRERQAIGMRGDDNIHDGRLSVVRRQLAQLSIARTLETDVQKQARSQLLRELSEEKESLERKRLESANAAGWTDFDNFSPPDLMARLPGRACVVQLVRAQRWSVAKTQQAEVSKLAHYEAFIVQHAESGDDLQVDWVDLGEASVIERHVDAWRLDILRRVEFSRGRRVRRDAEEPSVLPEARQFLVDHVWSPIAARLNGQDQVIIIPDGELHRLPWQALPGQESDYLVEEIQITTATDGRQLAQLVAEPHDSQVERLLLVGGVDYDLQIDPPANAVESLPREFAWPYLPGTEDEILAIKQVVPSDNTLMLVGAQASEERVKSEFGTANFIHLATHGFFAEQQVTDINLEGDANLAQTRELGALTLTARNPLLLCGLTLAGCNSAIWVDAQGLTIMTQEDGYLSAEELMGMDLRHTSLVVLSACETALGRITNSEGVFGLQRALHISGVKSTIASQWKVDDLATKCLMVEFYKELRQNKTPAAKALRAAQIKMLRYFDPGTGTMQESEVRKAAPYFWAAFNLCGVIE